MFKSENTCCKKEIGEKRGLLTGILLGILPHSFCLSFTIFSIVGAVTASAFLKKFLLLPNFFLILVVVSLVLATFSGAIYLKRNQCLCFAGVGKKWKYLAALYFATIAINLLMFFVVLPNLANMNSQVASKESAIGQSALAQEKFFSEASIKVQLPCSGHVALIIDEIKKNCEVESVVFSLPDTFLVKYDLLKTTPEKITSLEIFKTYAATLD